MKRIYETSWGEYVDLGRVVSVTPVFEDWGFYFKIKLQLCADDIYVGEGKLKASGNFPDLSHLGGEAAVKKARQDFVDIWIAYRDAKDEAKKIK